MYSLVFVADVPKRDKSVIYEPAHGKFCGTIAYTLMLPQFSAVFSVVKVRKNRLD